MPSSSRRTLPWRRWRSWYGPCSAPQEGPWGYSLAPLAPNISGCARAIEEFLLDGWIYGGMGVLPVLGRMRGAWRALKF